MTVRQCPVHRCESLILAKRPVCFGHLMSLPALDRDELSRLAKFAPGSTQFLVARANAVDYLNSLQPRRVPS